MSKESDTIMQAYRLGQRDKRAKKPYRNPFNDDERRKKVAYRSGYNSK